MKDSIDKKTRHLAADSIGQTTAEPRHLSIWWRLLRPHTLTASIIPVLVGTALALLNGRINISLFASMLLASMIIQSAANMFNEYYDFKKGLDTAESVGIGGAIVRYGVREGTVFNLAVSLCIIALLLGTYICLRSNWWLAPIGLVCIGVGYLYTGGPYPIAYTPLGEIVAGFFMGFVIIMISFFIQTGIITMQSIVMSVPVSILIGAILLANNIRDLEGDRAKGRHTLAVLLDKINAIRLLQAMLAFSYLFVIAVVYLRLMTPWLLLVLLSLPKAIRAARGFSGKSTPSQMMPAMQATAQCNTQFGLLIVLAIIVKLALSFPM